MLVKLTMDPQELYLLNKHIHYARALENQAYLVSTNGTGFFNAINLYGNSLVISPEGNVLCEAGQTPLCVYSDFGSGSCDEMQAEGDNVHGSLSETFIRIRVPLRLMRAI